MRRLILLNFASVIIAGGVGYGIYAYQSSKMPRQCFETGLIWSDALWDYCSDPDTGMESDEYDLSRGDITKCVEYMAGSKDEYEIVRAYAARVEQGFMLNEKCIGEIQ